MVEIRIEKIFDFPSISDEKDVFVGAGGQPHRDPAAGRGQGVIKD